MLAVVTVIVLSWLGLFREIETWFADHKIATVELVDWFCSDGSDCKKPVFYEGATGDFINGECVGDCVERIPFLNEGKRYFLTISNFPLVGTRILEVRPL